jgi:GntR family transcriptional regulator
LAEAQTFIKPDRRRAEPLWHQAEMALRSMIEKGEWPAGSQIPNEDRLSAMLGISRITLRHALRNLEEAGLLRREHGRGTFVRSATMVAGARGLTSFTSEMQSLGMTVGTRVLSADVIPATDQIADAIEMRSGEPVLRLRRLRLGNDMPIGIQTAHLPLALVPGLEQDAVHVSSLYETLKARYGIVPTKANEVYRVGTVSAEDAELIQLAAGTPAFVVERTTYSSRGAFEFTTSTMRADRYEIRSTLYV